MMQGTGTLVFELVSGHHYWLPTTTRVALHVPTSQVYTPGPTCQSLKMNGNPYYGGGFALFTPLGTSSGVLFGGLHEGLVGIALTP